MGTSAEAPRRSSHDLSSSSQNVVGGAIVAPMPSDSNDDPLKRAAKLNITHGTGGNMVEGQRPALPPRPSLLQTGNGPSAPQSPTRPVLQAKATTALSSLEIQTLSFPDGSRGTFSTPASGTLSEPVSELPEEQGTPSRKVSRNESDLDDDASLMSFAPTLRGNGDLASLLDDELNTQSPAWRLLNSQADATHSDETFEYEDTSLVNFEHEFDEIEAVDSNGGNEGKPRHAAFNFHSNHYL